MPEIRDCWEDGAAATAPALALGNVRATFDKWDARHRLWEVLGDDAVLQSWERRRQMATKEAL